MSQIDWSKLGQDDPRKVTEGEYKNPVDSVSPDDLRPIKQLPSQPESAPFTVGPTSPMR